MSLRTSLPLKQTHSVAASRKQAVPLPSPRPVWSQESHAPLLSHTQHTHTQHTHRLQINRLFICFLRPTQTDCLSVCQGFLRLHTQLSEGGGPASTYSQRTSSATTIGADGRKLKKACCHLTWRDHFIGWTLRHVLTVMCVSC